MCVSLPPSPFLPPLHPYHPGDRHIAKWSRSSCTTEATLGIVTTASPAPAATRSCWMEPASSWISTPLKMTTCWMGTLPPQVGSTGNQKPPWLCCPFELSHHHEPGRWWTTAFTVQLHSLNTLWASYCAASWKSLNIFWVNVGQALVVSHPATSVKVLHVCPLVCFAFRWFSSSAMCPLFISIHIRQLLCVPSYQTLHTVAPILTEATSQMVTRCWLDF